MKIELVIFDMDGTIIDDEKQYKNAFKTVLESLGGVPDDSFHLLGGVGVEKEWPRLLEKYHIQTDKKPEELAALTQEEYLKHIEEVTLRDGFLDFLNELKEKSIKTALATSNNWSIVDAIFKKFSLENVFDIVTTAEEVVELKPSPDLFLLTARKDDIDPKNCIVIEDAPSGIKAAQEAHMKVVAIADEAKGGDAPLMDANMVVWSYNELDVKSLEKLQ
ncbi:MAG TPA: HAD family phosphatase [Patescibacteria group bacterium]